MPTKGGPELRLALVTFLMVCLARRCSQCETIGPVALNAPWCETLCPDWTTTDLRSCCEDNN